MSEIPDRLNIDKKDRELYNKLDLEEITRFKDKGGTKTRKEQFIFAMAYAFNIGKKMPIDAFDGYFLEKDLHDDDRALIYAVAVYDTKSVEVLADMKAVFKIAEEYAHAGIILLANNKIPIGLYEIELEKELSGIFKKI